MNVDYPQLAERAGITTNDLAAALATLAPAYAQDPMSVQAALLNATGKDSCLAKAWHNKIEQDAIENRRTFDEKQELGLFFRQHFEAEIAAHRHDGKTDNQVIMAYLMRYYVTRRNSWWGRLLASVGFRWGI